MIKIPNRHNQQAVDRYAEPIATINANWPEVVVFDPEPFSMETFRSRLRDAVMGIVTYGVTHPTVPFLEVKKWSEGYTSKVKDGQLVVGGREQVRDYKRKTKTAGLTLDAEVKLCEVELNEPDMRVLEAMLVLQEAGYIEDLKFQFPLFDSIQQILDKHDMALEMHQSETHIHIF